MGEFSGHGESGHGRQQAKRQTGLERKARLELEGTEMHLRKFTIAVLLGTLTVTVRARPQSSGSGGGCGVSRDGVSRQVGDSWSQDGCNNCRCLPSGVPGCTRRICSDREFWEEGRTCSEGKTWEEKTGEDLKVCTCTKGSPSCTDKVVKVASTSPSQCGEDSEGNPRLVGDSWKEDCNNCRCTSTGVPVCTLRSCVNREEHECVDERGNRREHLEMWEEWEESWEEEERSSGIEVNGNHKDCSCDNGEVICQVRQLAEEETGAFVASSPGRLGENAVTCVGSNGTAREEGDSWMDDCNNCMCTESGNSCTKMLCNFALPFAMSGLRTGADSQCLDREGSSREIGETWMEACNNCRCTKSGSSCTKKLCNFLGHNLNPGLQCTDEQNLTREHLESWEQVPSPPEVVKEVADVQLVWLTDLSMEIQLEENKTDVIISDVVKTLRAGAKLDLLQAGDVHMTLRRDPEVPTGGGVSLALALTDGGEGNIVVGTSGSMYGAVKPLEGPVHYTLESCGQGCSVLIERSSDWFNQFED